MGWNVHDVKCPNCNQRAEAADRGSESFVMMCPHCGLHLNAQYKVWEVTSSYIDKSIIGKHADELQPHINVDTKRDNGIIKKGSILGE